jgi:hypothetical protein
MKTYKTYFYRGQDPMLTDAINRLMDTGTNFSQLAKASGVAPSTYSNWKKRKSKRTYCNTLNAALRGAGMHLEIVNGTGKKK